MRRYTFLLLAFFLSFGAHASIEEKSEMKTLGNIEESVQKAQQPSDNIPIGSVISNRSQTKMKQKTNAFSAVNCKTYEGDIYGRGEAGYNDCIKAIKTDHKNTRAVK